MTVCTLNDMSLDQWLSQSRDLLSVTRNGSHLNEAESQMVIGLLFGCIHLISASITHGLPLPGCQNGADGAPRWLSIQTGVHMNLAVLKAVELGYQVHGVHPEMKAHLEARWGCRFPDGFLA